VRVLVVNAGSSSLKLALLDARSDEPVASRELGESEDLASAVGEFGDVDAVGHRIVHGGERFRGPVVVDDEVRAALDELTVLAPLHQPPALAALDRVTGLLPGVPQVACFDTAFHATLPDAAAVYALPAQWRDDYGIRRFGFHGLSHAYVARRVPELLGRGTDELRVVSCHLGAGASLCAIAGGASVDTTMGFTPLEGLVMATRSGNVDPGLLLWLIEHRGLDAAVVSDALEHASGLAGLAGTADMREVLEREAAGDAGAALAVGVYLHRLRAAIAAMATACGGLDAVAFTAGVGERAPAIRARTADGLGFLGVTIDAGRNEQAQPDAVVSPDGAAVATLVIRAREDLEIARGVRAALAR